MSHITVIAEIGVNHDGDVGRAIEMVGAAADCGADIVKFQAFDAASLSAPSAATAPYQKQNTGVDDQNTLLRKLALTLDEFSAIAGACRDRKIEFLATPFSVEMLDALIGLGMKRIKVASGEMVNVPALRRFAAYDLPMIVSTGMATEDEIARTMAVIGEAGPAAVERVTLLQCTSLYPAPPEQMNLRVIPALRARFGVPVGLSDHSLGTAAAVAAAALGATVIEKHFTLDTSAPGPDHAASLEPDRFRAMVEDLRFVERMLGASKKRPSAAEIETARHVRRSWHAVRDLPAGAVVGDGDAALLRPASGLAPEESPIGRRLASPIAAGAAFTPAALAQ